MRKFTLFLLPLIFVHFTFAENIIFREGTFWQYRVSEEENNSFDFEVISSYSYTVVVAKVGTLSDFKNVPIDFQKSVVKISQVNIYDEDGNLFDSGLFTLNSDGSIWMFNSSGYGWMVYKKGLSVGYTWKAQMQEDVVSKFVCDGYEEVKTPAGSFKNVMKIVSSFEGDEEGKIKYWVVEGIGMVKSVSGDSYNKQITELVKYGSK
ncbi:MAG: hypothetical protein ACUVWP_03095 [bacterium]